MNNPLLSVVIPTKNRAFTLNDLINFFLTCNLDTVEIIIEDNSENINDYVKGLNSQNIRYFFSKTERSMVENCEVALSKARGTFVSMIGDDDGIDLALAKEIITRNKADFYLSPPCTFYWPGLNRRFYGQAPFGFEAKYSSCVARSVKPQLELRKVVLIGGVDMLSLPRLYQGIVKRSFLEKIKNDHGHYFNAPMPDMSSSVALSLYCNIGYLHDIPFIFNGASSNSGGGLGAQGKHVGRLENAYGLTSNQLAEWPSEVPKFWCGGTVWAASLITTVRKLDADHVLNELNKNYMYSHIIGYHFLQYFSIYRFRNLEVVHFLIASRIFLKRFASLLNNIGLYAKLMLGFGVKCNSMSEYLRVLYASKRARNRNFRC